jgi:hypothetical protein
MNKYFLIVIGLLALVCVFLLVKNVKKEEGLSKEIDFTYELNAGIPFKRVYEIEDESIVGFVNSSIVKDENTNGKVGASVYTKYVFKGLKEGETTITFKVVSITGEYEDTDIEVHKVKVDKDLNITVIGEKNEGKTK